MGAEPASQSAGTTVWFVQAGQKVWGPYPEARIEAFVAEGRVGVDTLISTDAQGPFRPAGRQARLHRLFGDVAVESAEVLKAAPAAMAETSGAARPLLVWAALRGQRGERFEELLGAHGAYVRIGPGLWLVRARLGPAALRNVMTRRLDSGDTLMVIEAPQDQAAWFNLDGDTDRTLRQLWGAEAR